MPALLLQYQLVQGSFLSSLSAAIEHRSELAQSGFLLLRATHSLGRGLALEPSKNTVDIFAGARLLPYSIHSFAGMNEGFPRASARFQDVTNSNRARRGVDGRWRTVGAGRGDRRPCPCNWTLHGGQAVCLIAATQRNLLPCLSLRERKKNHGVFCARVAESALHEPIC